MKELILHTFLDASQQACGAACYTRHLYENGSICCCLLVASRSYVEPLQAIAKARFKLMAAVLGVKLSQVVGQAPGIKKDGLDILVRQHGRNLLVSWTEQKVQTIFGKSCR